jgi:hypothetical protein
VWHPSSNWAGSNGGATVDSKACANGASTVSAVVTTELRVRSSRHQEAWAAASASAGPSRSRISATSATSWVSTQRTTSAILRRSRAAANNRGARNLAAVAYQNSPSAVVPSARAVSHRSAATRHAWRQSAHPVKGDHVPAGKPVLAVGSMHHT